MVQSDRRQPVTTVFAKYAQGQLKRNAQQQAACSASSETR
jgi:hypothetical protein